ncbi:MAG: UbiA prenyltransferase family protein [Promethearchaeota archaeon]
MVGKIRNLITLLRIRQYYKNAMIFIGIFFSESLFDISLYFSLILGFILLCCASSFNYIVNDIRDINLDKLHSEKLNKKPLASGALSVRFALLMMFILAAIITFSLIFLLPNLGFTLMILLIIVTGQLYNHFFKHYAFIDIIILSTGYLWRTLAGCILIDKFVSAWLFLSIFEIAIFLSIAKRKEDLKFLDKDVALKHKKAYDQYSLKLLEQFYTIIAGSLFITYSLYLIFKFNLFEPGIPTYELIAVATIPLALYILMRYMYLTSAKPTIARNPEKAFFDKGIIITALIIIVILFFAFYFDVIL